MVGIKRTKKSPPTVEVEDEYVPSATDDDDEESSGGSGEEEEEEDEENGEETEDLPVPPPKRSSAKKVKTYATATSAPATSAPPPSRKRAKAASDSEGDDEEYEPETQRRWSVKKDEPAPTKKTKQEESGSSRKKTKKTKGGKSIPSLTLKKTPASNTDYEVQLDNNSKVTDLSLSAPKYPKNKLLLDERYWTRIGSVNYKGKGISFEQLFIGRDPAKGDVNKDGSIPKSFQMGLPIRTLEPLRRAINFLTGHSTEKETAFSATVL